MILTKRDRSIPFEDIEIGETRRVDGARTMTEADTVNFAGVTGDFSLNHLSETYHEHTRFGRRIAHGNLVKDMAEAYLTGANGKVVASYGHDRIRFVKPVFIGDTLTFESEVVEKEDRDAETGRVVVRYTVENQHGEVVCVDDHILLVERA